MQKVCNVGQISLLDFWVSSATAYNVFAFIKTFQNCSFFKFKFFESYLLSLKNARELKLYIF